MCLYYNLQVVINNVYMQLSSLLAIAPHVPSTLGLINISLTALFEDNHKSDGDFGHSTVASRKCNHSKNHW